MNASKYPNQTGSSDFGSTPVSYESALIQLFDPDLEEPKGAQNIKKIMKFRVLKTYTCFLWRAGDFLEVLKYKRFIQLENFSHFGLKKALDLDPHVCSPKRQSHTKVSNWRSSFQTVYAVIPRASFCFFK